MKRAALIAGLSVADVVDVPDRRGLGRTATPTSGGAPTGRLHRYEPPPRRSFKPRSRRAESSERDRDARTTRRRRFRRDCCTSSSRSTSSARRCSPTAQPVASTAISTGTPGHPTPMGVFTVIQKRPPPRLQSLQRADALHAAHHLVGLGAARRAPARLSGVAWLRPADHELRAIALEGDQDGRARHRHPPRRRAARVRARPPVRAEAEDGGGAERSPLPRASAESGTSDDGAWQGQSRRRGERDRRAR